MSAKQRIKVVLGSNVKRESVLINPNVGVSGEETDNNVLATGTSSAAIAKKLYGRRK